MKFSHYLQYKAMLALVGGLRWLGWKRATRAGEVLGRFAFRFVRIRRYVAERQVAFSFPGKDAREIRRITESSYAHFARTAIESALLPSLSRDEVLALVAVVDGWDLVEQALEDGRGLILVTGHLGNWELGGSYLAARGLSVAAAAREMKNPFFDDYLMRTRSGFGARIFQNSDAVRLAPRHLRNNGLLALLADQGVLGLSSTFVPFFGRLARTPRGPAVLAIRLKAPLLFGTCIRQTDGRFHMEFERVDVPLSGEREKDVDAMVAAYTSSLERSVQRAPEQYFWMHRRWKRQPPGMPLLEDHEI